MTNNKVFIVNPSMLEAFIATGQLEEQGYQVLNANPNVQPDLKQSIVILARKAGYCLLMPGWNLNAESQTLAFISVTIGVPAWECKMVEGQFEFRLADLQFELQCKVAVENEQEELTRVLAN